MSSDTVSRRCWTKHEAGHLARKLTEVRSWVTDPARAADLDPEIARARRSQGRSVGSL